MHAILGNHPDFAVFPEANILYTAVDDLDFRQFGTLMGRAAIPHYLMQRAKNRLGHTNGLNTRCVKRFLESVGRPDLMDLMPRRPTSMRAGYAFFDRMMSEISAGKRWIEKSPQNIFCIEYIERYIKDARFVHVVRNGQDTVSSLIDAASKYDTFRHRFGGENGVRKAVSYYNAATKISLRMQGRARHAVVRYEDIAQQSPCALSEVAELCDIEITPEMLQYEPDKIIMNDEIWKTRSSNKIEPAQSKFDSVFDSAQKDYINANVIRTESVMPRCS